MRDPFTWSLPLGRMFGIHVRMHILFPLFVLVMWLRAVVEKPAPPAGYATDTLVVLALLFFAVLLHELGHCFGARLMEGDAREILLWPLGGLARCDVPSTPRANFVTSAAGPAANLLLCLVSGLILAAAYLRPSLDPTFDQLWRTELYSWANNDWYGNARYAPELRHHLDVWQVHIARFFWINWVLFLINVCILGFPMDGGQMAQALLWPRLGYKQSMLTAIFLGFLFMFLIGVYALVQKDPLIFCLALFIYFACKQQWIILETGGEESLFGYDFSQGYTSLERDQPRPPRRPRPNALQRWLQRRAARKLLREQERQMAEEQRMDELLEKIQRQGRQALTDEENRFLKRVADKYRHRH
jgi:stage IV sporulation protein FB